MTLYKGRKYLCLARCSTNVQAETSIPDQLKLLRAYGDEKEMIFVDEYIVDGVTGSVAGARDDIERIIQRKKTKNDFDVLLVQDMSRFTRVGAEHGMKLEYDLNAAGVEVIFVAEGLPEGDHAGIIKTVGFYAAQQSAKSLSYAVARGLMSSLQQGRIAHALAIPYGVDRMLVSLDGNPLHVIRNLSDGTQLKINPVTNEVLATFESERGKKNRACHYRMQSNERVVLIPGAPERVEAVRHMFRRRLIDGWAGFRIARELDQMGIRSSSGKPWAVTTINHILANPVYTGIGIANRYSGGIYNKRSANAPKPSMVDRKTLAHRKKPKQQIRPRAEWIEVRHPLLENYLGDLRDRAVAWQKEQLNRQDPSRSVAPASKDRHVDSTYFLKGILKSKDGNHALMGRTTGTPQTRYYAINRGFTTPKTDKTLRRLIPAEELEQTVLRILSEVLLSAPDLREKLVAKIQNQRDQRSMHPADLKTLEAERTKLQNQIEFVIDSLGDVGREAARTKLQQLETKLSAVMQKIDEAKTESPTSEPSSNEVADDIIAKLVTLGKSIKTLPMQALRSVAQSMIRKLEVDMTTKAIQIEIGLPNWTHQNPLCLDEKFFQRYVYQAQIDLPMDSADCQYRRVGRNPCFECHRRRAA